MKVRPPASLLYLVGRVGDLSPALSKRTLRAGQRLGLCDVTSIQSSLPVMAEQCTYKSTNLGPQSTAQLEVGPCQV